MRRKSGRVIAVNSEYGGTAFTCGIKGLHLYAYFATGLQKRFDWSKAEIPEKKTMAELKEKRIVQMER